MVIVPSLTVGQEVGVAVTVVVTGGPAFTTRFGMVPVQPILVTKFIV